MGKMRISIFEDSKHLRESLEIVLNGTPDLICAGAYPDCNALQQRIERDQPDIVLMDIELPGMNGIEATAIIKSRFPEILVLIQTVFANDDFIFRAICAGASGYILKTTSLTGYLEAIQDVKSGGSPMTPGIARRMLELFRLNIPVMKQDQQDFRLTEKEKDVLQHLVSGKSYKMIASQMQISVETVKSHLTRIYQKLHVNSNTEAVAIALRNGIV